MIKENGSTFWDFLDKHPYISYFVISILLIILSWVVFSGYVKFGSIEIGKYSNNSKRDTVYVKEPIQPLISNKEGISYSKKVSNSSKKAAEEHNTTASNISGDGAVIVGGENNHVSIQVPDISMSNPSLKIIDINRQKGAFKNTQVHGETVFQYQDIITISFSSATSKNQLEASLNYKGVFHINISPQQSNMATVGGGYSDEKGNQNISFISNPLNGIYNIKILSNELLPNIEKLCLIRIDGDKIYSMN